MSTGDSPPDETRRVLWTVTDPRGLTVVCAEETWQEHLLYRPELGEHVEAVRQTVQAPDEISFDPVSTRKKRHGVSVYWYYQSGLTKGFYAGNLVAVVVKVVLEADGVK
jgi:hypothetical protein